MVHRTSIDGLVLTRAVGGARLEKPLEVDAVAREGQGVDAEKGFVHTDDDCSI